MDAPADAVNLEMWTVVDVNSEPEKNGPGETKSIGKRPKHLTPLYNLSLWHKSILSSGLNSKSG